MRDVAYNVVPGCACGLCRARQIACRNEQLCSRRWSPSFPYACCLDCNVCLQAAGPGPTVQVPGCDVTGLILHFNRAYTVGLKDMLGTKGFLSSALPGWQCQLIKSIAPNLLFKAFPERPWPDTWWSSLLDFMPCLLLPD